MSITIANLAQRPDLEPLVWDEGLQSAWPRFMLEDPFANLVFAPGRLDRFLDYVLVAFDPDQPGMVFGRGVSVPFCFGPDFGRPNLRVHGRAGGRIVGIAPCSMTIAGSRTEWRSWTGLPFEQSGDVVVPGALAPVHVSVEQHHAVYVEPNVWVHHRV